MHLQSLLTLLAVGAFASVAMGQGGGGPRTRLATVAPFDAKQARRHQEEWAQHLGIEVETANSIGQKFVVIPPGTFTMGEGDDLAEVTLTNPFLLGQTEVTNKQWGAVMGFQPRLDPHFWENPDQGLQDVSWEDAVKFCQKLSALPDERKAGRVYRLPTEAEWEYACRAGTDTEYSFGDDVSLLGEYAWYDKNSGSYSKSHPVGKKKANAWGLFDMHGNVWEWCSDKIFFGDSTRVCRGGDSRSTDTDCRSAVRRKENPSQSLHLGFRLALTLYGAPPAVAPFDAKQARRHQEEWAQHLGIEVETANSIGQKFVVIPPGTFAMGGGDDPAEVTLTNPFLLGQTEVTNKQWERVMRSVRSVPSAGGQPDLPVTKVSWEDAVKFCQQLSALPSERRAGRVYRLPTEAEWEYACRAGTKTAYSFANDKRRLEEYAWWIGSKPVGEPHPVGMKKPNPWGLFDMHGNVWEWCSDWRWPGAYPKGAATDPKGPPVPSATMDRVCRGGSFTSDAEQCRSAWRSTGGSPSYRHLDRGFRLVLRLPGAQPPKAGR